MNSFTKSLTAAALVTASGIAGAAANDIAGNVSMVTNYVWRGVSQTNEKPAIQGGFDYSHDFEPITWYVGTWGSNVDPAFFGGTHSPSMELDTYTGFTGKKDDFTYNAGWLRYNYPGGNSNATTEWKIGGGWKWIGAEYYYSPDWFGTHNNSSRIEGTVNYQLPYEIALSGAVANNYGDGTDVFFNNSYVDWRLGVSKSWMGVNWGLTYSDTSINKDDCPASKDICGTAFVASLSKSF